MDKAITRTMPRAVGEFEGYVDGEPSVRWFDRKRMPGVGDKLFLDPARAAGIEPRMWSILLTSGNHGAVGPFGSQFPHAGERHERVKVVEIVEAGAPPAPGTDPGGLVRLKVAELVGSLDEVYSWARDLPIPTRGTVAAMHKVRHVKEALAGAPVAAQASHDDDADVADLEVRDALGEHYDHEVGEAVSVLRIMAAWKAEAELGEKYKKMAFGAAQAGQVAVPEDRQKLAQAVLTAGYRLAAAEYRSARNAGAGGPGFEDRVARAEKAFADAVDALAAAPSAPAVAQQAPAATIDTREFRELLAKAMDAAELATRTGDPHRDYKPARDALVEHINARLAAAPSPAKESK